MEANPFDAVDPVAVEVEPPVANPFDRFDADGDAADPSLGERWRLNETESYYRGTLRGSSALSTMATIVKMRNEGAADDDILGKVAHPFMGMTETDFATPQEYKSSRAKWVKDRADEYNRVTTELARYDAMKPWGDTLEAGAALTGVLAGGLQSPESFLGAGAKGASWLARTGKAALQQAGIMGAADPLVQSNNIDAQVQEHYEPARTAGAIAMGAVIGGGLHLATGELVPALKLRRTIAEASSEDPSFRRADIAPEAAGEPKPAPGPEVAPAPEPVPVGPAESAPTAPEPIIHRVATAAGKSVDVKPMVVEAKDLIASTDAGYDASLQPRDRSRAASEQQIREMAANLDPERLGHSTEADRGAPITGPDNMIESGNGRVMAIREAYAQGGEAAQRYRDWIASQGVDVSGFKEPILVRQRVTDMTPEERRAFTVSANQSATLTMSAPERALADSRLIGGAALDLIRNPEDLGALGNRDFIRTFVSKLPQAEQGAMMNAEGGLSSEGLTRVRNAVLASAYGDAHVLTRIAEATSDEVKSISNALVSVAPHWAKLRSDVASGHVRADIDQTGALVEAVTRTADLRVKGMKLEAFLAQQDAFERVTPIVEDFMRMFYDRSGRKAAGASRIADALRFYAEEGRKVSDSGLDLGLPPVTPEELQRVARERAQGGPADQPDIFTGGGVGDGAGAAPGSREVPGQGTDGAGGRARSEGGGSNSGGGVGAVKGELFLAARQSDGSLSMERSRPDAGIADAGQGTATGTALATVPEAPAPKDVAIRSLQQQSMDFAKAIDFPLREGRITKNKALGIYKTGSGVVRVREVPDFEVVAHEGGHAIEAKVGKQLTDLTEHYVGELGPLDYDPNLQRANEGFAEFVRRYIGNPAHAEQVAPGFTIAFRDFMQRKAPDIMKAIDEAGAAYRAYLEAPSVDAVGAVRRSRDEQPKGFLAKSIAAVNEDGFGASVKTVLQHAYTALLDEKAPVARAVREMMLAIKERSGNLVDLKAADNPEVLLRMFGRAEHAGIRDLMDGVRPYRGVEPEGPSLSDAIRKATGQATVFGRWDKEGVATFSTYLIARRAEWLWRKFDKGDLPNPPAAFGKGDATVAMAELERANPTFREASDMVHGWTRQLLRKQFEGGLIGRDLYDKLLGEEFYVPFMRDLSDKPLAGGDSAVRGSADRVADTVMRMRGSARDIKDPLESLMTQAFLVNRTLKHNDIIRSFVDLARKAGPDGGRYVEPLPAHEAKRYTFDLAETIERLAKERGVPADDVRVLTGALTDVFGEDPLVGQFFRMEPTSKRGEPIVFYKEGGELRAARFMSGEEGHALYETLTTLPTGLSDLGLQLLSTSSAVLRSGVVTNPVFALTNYIRDQVAVGILRSDYVPFVSGTQGIVSEVTQGEAAKLYAYAGGVSPGAAVAPLREAAESNLNALAKQGYLVNRLSSLHGLLELSQITEAGTRNSVFAKVYDAKKAQGLSEYEAMIEAAYQAQDILDFSRWGSKTMAVRALTPFVNAHMQGLEKAYRTLIEPLVREAATTTDAAARTNAMIGLTKAVAVGGALGAAWAAFHAHDEIYQDASPDLKGTHFVTTIGNKIFVIPKPFELSIGFTAGEFAYQRLMKEDQRAAAQFAEAAWQVIKPPIPIFDNPLIKTSIELGLGKSTFTGRDIVPDRLQRLDAPQQYTDRTSSLAKEIGKLIGVSPIKVDYGMAGYFGLWGRDIMTLSSGVNPDAPAQSMEDMALVRRFIKDPTRSSDVTTKFWGFMGQTSGKFNQAVNTYDSMVKGFRDQDAKEFLTKLPANERTFTILKSAANEEGKPAFSTDERRLHPLQRSYDAVTLLNGMRGEISDNAFKTFENGENIKLSPVQRRDLLDSVRELAQKEMRNGFVIMKEPGYANRPLMTLDDTMARIRNISPEVGNEIAARYATSKIYRTDAVAKSYASMQSTVLREGGEADLSNFTDEAQAQGYEFGAERVKRPPKRRIEIRPR